MITLLRNRTVKKSAAVVYKRRSFSVNGFANKRLYLPQKASSPSIFNLLISAPIILSPPYFPEGKRKSPYVLSIVGIREKSHSPSRRTVHLVLDSKIYAGISCRSSEKKNRLSPSHGSSNALYSLPSSVIHSAGYENRSPLSGFQN